MRARTALLFLLAAGCLPQEELALDGSFASAVVFLGARSQPRARAYDLDGALPPTAVAAADGDAFVLLYRESLARWAIQAGELEAADAETGRALPPADRALMFDGDWSTVTALPSAVAEFRFKTLSAEECADRGGCWESVERPYCVACPPPDAPEAPTAPALPNLAPCAPGWEAVPEGELVRCDPAVTDAAACAPEELALPSSGCVPLGAPCPTADLWPIDLPPGTAIFVREGAVGGDGTRPRPFGSLAEATAAAPRGAVLALARGQYAVDRAGEVTLLGACADGTSLSSTVGIVTSATVANLTVTGSLQVEGPSARLALHDVALAASGRLIVRSGAAATARNLRVLSATTAPSIIVEGAGLDLAASVLLRSGVSVTGGRLTISNVRLQGRGARVLLEGASELSASEVVLDRAGGSLGPRAQTGLGALGLRDGSHAVVNDLWARSSTIPVDAVASGLEIERAWLEDSSGSGLFLSTGSATVSDLVIRGVRTRGEGTGGVFSTGGCLRMERAFIEHVEGPGVAAFGGVAGCTRLTDLVSRNAVRRSVRGTGEHEDPHGLLIRGNDVELSRSLLADNEDAGLFVEYFAGGPFAGRESVVTALDVMIRGNRRTGLKLEQRTHLRGERIEIRENMGAGIYVKPEMSSLELVDLRVLDSTGRGDCGAFATDCLPAGLRANAGALFDGGVARISRFEIARNDEHGVAFSDNLQVQLTHGLISGHRVGARLIGAATPISSVFVGVLYRDNERPIVRGVE